MLKTVAVHSLVCIMTSIDNQNIFFYSHPQNTTIEYGSIKRWGCCWEGKGFYILVQHLKQGSYGVFSPPPQGGGGNSPKYLNGYVSPNGVVILGTQFRDVSQINGV